LIGAALRLPQKRQDGSRSTAEKQKSPFAPTIFPSGLAFLGTT